MKFFTKFILSLVVGGAVVYFIKDWVMGGLSFVVLLFLLTIFFRKKKLTPQERYLASRDMRSVKGDLDRVMKREGLSAQQERKIFANRKRYRGY